MRSGVGVNEINKYDWKELKNNSFELIYEFTDEQYQAAENCS